jgi:hypothetical protein
MRTDLLGLARPHLHEADELFCVAVAEAARKAVGLVPDGIAAPVHGPELEPGYRLN